MAYAYKIHDHQGLYFITRTVHQWVDVFSRRSWLMWLFKPKEGVTFWQPDNHAKEINSRDFFIQKMQYIHQNPVRAGPVDREEAWMYSSTRDFYNMKGLLKLSYFD